MMTEKEIIADIRRVTCGNNSVWAVGVTDNPARQKLELEKAGKSNKHWHDWDASTEAEARRIEAFYLEKGCESDRGDGGGGRHVYIL